MHMVRDLVHEALCSAFVNLFTEEMDQLTKNQAEVKEASPIKSIKLIAFYLKELYKTE